MKLLFLKDRLKYKKGNTYEVSDNQLIRAFIEFNVAKICFNQNQNQPLTKEESPLNSNLDNLTYKELRLLCKKKNLRAVGKRDDLITSLNEVGV